MTLSELLEELMGLDPETWDAIVRGIPLKPFCQYFTFDRCGQIAHQYQDVYLPFSQMERDVALLWLQGRIQRACEKQGWTWSVYKQTPGEEKSHYAEISEIGPGYDGDYYNQYHESCITWKEANSPAEALLGAYITAIKMKQSASKKQYKKCGDFYMDTTIDSSKTKGNKINELIY
jgi:hypothetical protein